MQPLPATTSDAESSTEVVPRLTGGAVHATCSTERLADTRAPPPMARSADRLSGLPEGVLHHILSLLPSRDAVRTCVLAQSWRNRWRSAPFLRITFSELLGQSTAPFVDALFRARPELYSWDIDLHMDPRSIDRDSRLIRRVLELKVRELQIRAFGKPEYPFGILSSRYLTSVELSGVQLEHDPAFPACPVLEWLKLEASLIYSQELQSRSLKHLIIISCSFDCVGRISMYLPSLVEFVFVTNSGRAPELGGMPCLEVAKVEFNDDCDDRCKNGRLDDCGDDACEGDYYGDGESGSVLLHGLAEATYLDLSAYPDMYVFSRDLKWCPAFNKLKILVLNKWFLSTDLSALIWFLHHAPLLKKLTLEIPKDQKSLMGTEGSYNPLETSTAPSHLQIVEIICKDVNGIVLEVLKVLDANGIPLWKIRIQCSGYNFVCTDINK